MQADGDHTLQALTLSLAGSAGIRGATALYSLVLRLSPDLSGKGPQTCSDTQPVQTLLNPFAEIKSVCKIMIDQQWMLLTCPDAA